MGAGCARGGGCQCESRDSHLHKAEALVVATAAVLAAAREARSRATEWPNATHLRLACGAAVGVAACDGATRERQRMAARFAGHAKVGARAAQDPLLGAPAVCGRQFQLGRDAESHLDEVGVEERHPSLHAVAHRHPVGPLEVDVVQRADRSAQLGVQGVVTGGQTLNPSTAELLDAVEAVNAQQVIVLPNNKNIIPVAEQLDALTSKSVVVVPTRSMPEALAALVVYDPEAGVDVNGPQMVEAAASVDTGEVTQAVRASQSDVGPISEGDWIGIVRGDGIVAVAGSLDGAVAALLDHLVRSTSEISSWTLVHSFGINLKATSAAPSPRRIQSCSEFTSSSQAIESPGFWVVMRGPTAPSAESLAMTSLPPVMPLPT